MAKSRKISRRKFLQTSVAAGAALSLPWLPGCGEDPLGAADSPPIRRRQIGMHFDLSHSQYAGPFVLHAIGTHANKVHLSNHTAATRAEFRRRSRRLSVLRDAQLTHFAETVDLPVNRVQQIWVTAGTSAAAPIVLSKIFCGEVDLSDPDSWVSARDYAVALIFHHPEIARLDVDQAAIVCAHIQGSYLDDLEAAIAQNNGFEPIPVTRLDGTPLLNDDGEQLVQFDPTNELLAEADVVVKEVLARIFDDPELEGANWQAAEGQTSVVVSGTDDLLTAADDPQFDADFPADPGNRSSAHGLYFTDLKLVDRRPGQRTIQLDVKNSYFRFILAWADFVDQNGKGVESTEKPNNGGRFDKDIFNIRDSDNKLVLSRFVSVISPTADFLGIPVRVGDSRPTSLKFVMPDGASRARLRFLTFGLRGSGFTQPGSQHEQAFWLPCSLTFVVNIGIPGFMIATGVGDTGGVQSLYQIATDPSFLVALLELLTLDLITLIITNDAAGFLISFASKFVGVALDALPLLAQWIATRIGLAAALQAIPIVGWAAKIASLTASTAKLTQAVSQILTNPPLFENKISVLLTTKVSIRHDPRNAAGFPATATKWVMQATYDGRVGQTIKGDLNGTQTEPIDRQFRTNSGGFGTIEVWFLTDNDWIAGYGKTDKFLNVAESGVIEQTITIEENLVPLTAQTRYHHREKLVRDSNDRYAWQAALDMPPTHTASSLVCDDNSLCDLNGITLSDNAAIAGYAWQARSRTLPLCGGGTTNSRVQRMQNVSFTQRPNDGLKRSLCGYTGKPLLAYERDAKPGEPARSFYLDPTGAGGGYHLREVSLNTSPFDQTAPLSWGQFAQQQDSIAIHPAGYVVGINTRTHKLEILQLPELAMPDDRVTASVLQAGRGTRVGLLDTPLAVGVDLLCKAIYVLEGGNARVQAFDVNGNPVKRFMNETSAERPLLVEPTATYLDMAVESTGWIYLLSFVGSGRNASDYRLDLYDPNESKRMYTSRTTGVAAAKLAVSLWRNVYTLNYEPLAGPHGPEPTISQWIPSTPDGCDQMNNQFCESL